MWKKLENFASSRTDADPNQAPNLNDALDSQSLEDPWLVGKQDADPAFEGIPQEEIAPEHSAIPQPPVEQAPPATLGAYTEAVKKFTKSASAFIEQLPLLAEAREAYEDATRASMDLRKVLDSGDENLRTLMTHLEQMANIHLVNVPAVKSTTERRKPESSKLAPVRTAEELKGGMKRFP
jgi:hypothetical protein